MLNINHLVNGTAFQVVFSANDKGNNNKGQPRNFRMICDTSDIKTTLENGVDDSFWICAPAMKILADGKSVASSLM